MVSSLRRAFLVAFVPAALTAQAGSDQFKSGRAKYDSQKFDDAVKAFEKAVSADEKNAEYHLWLARSLGSVAQRASVLRQPFLARRVKSEFEKTVQLDPSNFGGHDGLLSFYLQAPGLMGGSVGKARLEAEAIAKISPMRGHFARANIAMHEKDTVTFEKETRAALAAFPDSAIALSALVNFLAGTNRADEAFATLDKHLARKPSDTFGLWMLGRTAAISGRQLDRGEQALKQVLGAPGVGTDAALPAPAAIHYRMGDIAAKRGDKPRAKAEYEEALKLNPRLEAAKKALATLP